MCFSLIASEKMKTVASQPSICCRLSIIHPINMSMPWTYFYNVSINTLNQCMTFRYALIMAILVRSSVVCTDPVYSSLFCKQFIQQYNEVHKFISDFSFLESRSLSVHSGNCWQYSVKRFLTICRLIKILFNNRQFRTNVRSLRFLVVSLLEMTVGYL